MKLTGKLTPRKQPHSHVVPKFVKRVIKKYAIKGGRAPEVNTTSEEVGGPPCNSALPDSTVVTGRGSIQ